MDCSVSLGIVHKELRCQMKIGKEFSLKWWLINKIPSGLLIVWAIYLDGR
jgi:hypothetical protein